jgi:hypothetical protein
VELKQPVPERLPVKTHLFLTMQVQTNTSSLHNNSQFGTVSFFVNGRRVGVAALPRPVTDCFNDLEGPLVGDFGVDLSNVR